MMSASDVAIFQLTQNILLFIVKVWCISEGTNDNLVLRILHVQKILKDEHFLMWQWEDYRT